MEYIQVVYSTDDSNIQEILMAELAECGFESFEEGKFELKAYILADSFKEEDAGQIANTYGLEHTISRIEQQNWNATWEESFAPVIVDDYCIIRADFHPEHKDVTFDIVITPKMSFGTGHHATTRLMVQQMRKTDLIGKSVFDFGTGTGVLAILARMSGAGNVVAIDNDEWSYDNTLENIERNNVDNIQVHKGSLEVVAGQQFDIILANINRHILLEYMTDMKKMLNNGGVILMSGILTDDKSIITEAAAEAGLTLLTGISEDNWLCLSFEND